MILYYDISIVGESYDGEILLALYFRGKACSCIKTRKEVYMNYTFAYT